MTDGLSPGVQPSIRMTASSAGSWCRTSWIFSSCSRVETIAAFAPAVLQDVARLHRRERRIDRNGDRAAGQDGQVGDQPLGPALGHDRDAIAGATPSAPSPSDRSRMRSKKSLLEIAVDPVRAAAPDQQGILKPARDVKRQVGDGVEVDRRDLIHTRRRGCCRHAGIIACHEAAFTASERRARRDLKQ